MALYVAFIARVRRENRQARARREAIREERRRQYEMRVKSENLISEYDLQNSVDQVIEDVKKETKADDNNKSQ
jgi:F0F1-type ATP synthase membrane subunit b/b'